MSWPHLFFSFLTFLATQVDAFALQEPIVTEEVEEEVEEAPCIRIAAAKREDLDWLGHGGDPPLVGESHVASENPHGQVRIGWRDVPNDGAWMPIEGQDHPSFR